MPDDKDAAFHRSMEAYRQRLAERDAKRARRKARLRFRWLRAYKGPLIAIYFAGFFHRLALSNASGVAENALAALVSALAWGLVFPIQFILGFLYAPSQSLEAWIGRPVGGLLLIAGVIWLVVRIGQRRFRSDEGLT